MISKNFKIINHETYWNDYWPLGPSVEPNCSPLDSVRPSKWFFNLKRKLFKNIYKFGNKPKSINYGFKKNNYICLIFMVFTDGRLVGWLVGRSVGWSTGWLVGWLVKLLLEDLVYSIIFNCLHTAMIFNFIENICLVYLLLLLRFNNVHQFYTKFSPNNAIRC